SGSTCGASGIPVGEIPADHLLELYDIGGEVFVERLPLVSCQWLLRVRVESGTVSIAEAHMLEVGGCEVRRRTDVAECLLVQTAWIALCIIVQDDEEVVAEAFAERLQARRVPTAADDPERIALGWRGPNVGEDIDVLREIA